MSVLQGLQLVIEGVNFLRQTFVKCSVLLFQDNVLVLDVVQTIESRLDGFVQVACDVSLKLRTVLAADAAVHVHVCTVHTLPGAELLSS